MGSDRRVIDFYEGNDVNSSSAFSCGTIEGKPIQQVPLDQLRGYFKKEGLILLIDVEGYELNVLIGAARLIREKLPLIIFE